MRSPEPVTTLPGHVRYVYTSEEGTPRASISSSLRRAGELNTSTSLPDVVAGALSILIAMHSVSTIILFDLSFFFPSDQNGSCQAPFPMETSEEPDMKTLRAGPLKTKIVYLYID